jgi:hypothetical protein
MHSCAIPGELSPAHVHCQQGQSVETEHGIPLVLEVALPPTPELDAEEDACDVVPPPAPPP